MTRPSASKIFCYLNLALGGAIGSAPASPVASRRTLALDNNAPVPFDVSAYFGDHMVLHHADASVFGTAPHGENIQIEIPELDLTVQTQAHEDATWEARPGALPPGGPYTLRISGPRQIVFSDVLAGEVWMLSGQSNLDVTLGDIADGSGWFGNYSEVWRNRAEKTLGDVDNPYLRLMTTERTWADDPVRNIAIKLPWEAATYKPVRYSGAIGYLMGEHLQRKLGTPVGIVFNSAAGSAIRQWLPSEKLQGQYLAEGADRERASSVYNGMIAPVRGVSLSGAVWYQGESDTGAGHSSGVDLAAYPTLLAHWCDTIREVAHRPDLPVLLVQLAGWGAPQTAPIDGACGACLIREAQAQQALHDPHAALVVTTDTSSPGNIHPPDKWTVAHRLTMGAMRTAYAATQVRLSPTFKDSAAGDGFIDINFHHADGGLVPHHHRARPQGLAICANDGVWHWADATLVNDGQSLRVSHPDISEPAAVRYNWATNPVGNLFHTSGLPVSPWRTDFGAP